MMKKILVALALSLAGNGYATENQVNLDQTSEVIAKTETKQKRSFFNRYFARDTKKQTTFNVMKKGIAAVIISMATFSGYALYTHDTCAVCKQDSKECCIGTATIVYSLLSIPALRELCNYEAAEKDTPAQQEVFQKEIATQE